MLAPLVIMLLAQPPPPEKNDQVQVLRGQAAYDLEWSDAEDRMHGTVRPLDPVALKPVEVSLMVGTYQGPEFDGPVSATMRCNDWSETRTVKRGKSERAWFAMFVPPDAGECSIDVSFTTTRLKLLHVKLPVQPAPLSRLPWYVIIVLVTVVALGLGVRSIFKKPEAQ
jgi:hypothetical protein